MSGVFEQLRSAVMVILSDGAVWKTGDIADQVSQQIDAGKLEVRTMTFRVVTSVFLHTLYVR